VEQLLVVHNGIKLFTLLFKSSSEVFGQESRVINKSPHNKK